MAKILIKTMASFCQGSKPKSLQNCEHILETYFLGNTKPYFLESQKPIYKMFADADSLSPTDPCVPKRRPRQRAFKMFVLLEMAYTLARLIKVSRQTCARSKLNMVDKR